MTKWKSIEERRAYYRNWVKEYRSDPKRKAAHRKWMNDWYARTKAEVLAGKSCACCGTIKQNELDHIAGTPNESSAQTTLREYLKSPANFQFLCRPCNISKRDGSVCVKHDKYLGIWNYLRPLTNLG